MKKFLFPGTLFLFLLVAVAVPARGLAIGVEASAGGTQQYPSGTVSYKGISLDLKNDLNYDRVTAPIARVKLELPLVLPNLYFLAAPLTFEGRGVQSAGFQFGDQTFRGSVPFDSSLKLDHYDAAIFYGVPFLKTATLGKLKVEFGLNLRILDLKAEISQPQTSVTQSKKLLIPVPMGYFGLQINPIDKVGIEAELKAIAFQSSRYYDITGRIKWRMFKFLFLSGGYKYHNLKVDQSDVKTDLMFGGPQIELGAEF